MTPDANSAPVPNANCEMIVAESFSRNAARITISNLNADSNAAQANIRRPSQSLDSLQAWTAC